MKLKEVLKGVSVVKSNADMEQTIHGIAYDSRKVTEGSLFVAVSGFVTDGNQYIPMALQKGASVIVTATEPASDIPYVLVESDRMALALISRNYYADPASAMTTVGITGTNGKTTATLLLKHILETVQGAKVGLIGTMDVMIGDTAIPATRTTPESLELQEDFAKMRDAGCQYMIMEVSSHAIALDRVAGITYDLAAFTNLTEDHLDFHKTMENYCDTKAKLFARSKMQVANCDDPWYARMCESAAGKVLPTSVKSEQGLHARNTELLSDGVRFTAVLDGAQAEVSLPIPGRFSIYNALTAIGCAVTLGIPLEEAAKALKSAGGVKGRVEVVPTPGKPYTVLIDYAHTPDGLENVLTSVRDFCKGRLISVFGCGGDRDPIKRPIMGKIGVSLSDIAIITSDNPRTEDPMAIIRDIEVGAQQTGKKYCVIENRPAAIRHAMDIAQNRDIIVLAGKGHETYQEINGVKYPLDERTVVAQYLRGSEA